MHSALQTSATDASTKDLLIFYTTVHYFSAVSSNRLFFNGVFPAKAKIDPATTLIYNQLLRGREMNPEEKICHNCGFANEGEFLFCRKCGASLIENQDDTEKVLLLEDNAAKPKGISFTRIGLGLLGVFFMLMFIGLLIPNMGRSRYRRPQAREKACYANMRVILGALEMYNMDHTEMVDSINDADVTREDGFLIRGHYLKAPVNRPESGCFYSGRNLNGTGRIECAEHGTVEGPDD